MTNVPFLLIGVIPLIILHSSFLNSHKIRNSKLFFHNPFKKFAFFSLKEAKTQLKKIHWQYPENVTYRTNEETNNKQYKRGIKRMFPVLVFHFSFSFFHFFIPFAHYFLSIFALWWYFFPVALVIIWPVPFFKLCPGNPVAW